MKSKILIFAIFISLAYSCKLNNTSLVAITSNDLAGTWTIQSMTMDNVVLNVSDPIVTTLSGNGFGKNFNSTLVFSENPNTAVMTGDFVFQLTYTEPSGRKIQEDLVFDNIFFNDNFGATSSSWVLNENTLSLNQGVENMNIDVISYENNTLTIETDVNKSISLDGVTSTVVGKAIIEIQK